jgi:HupE/UreJ protein
MSRSMVGGVVHRMPVSLTAAVATALIGALACGAAAHDVPDDVKVQAFVKPAGEQLHLLVRVPLSAMREVDVPLRGPGYLDLARADAALRNAATLWLANNIEIREGEERLAHPKLVDARVTLPSDRSFGSYEEALAHLRGPRLPGNMDLIWNQQLLDVLFEYPIKSERSDFAIHPRLERLGLRVATVLRFLPPDGAVRAFEYHGDPGLIRLDPRWHQAALQFVKLGFIHILEGVDHLLFLLCLVIPLRRLWPLVVVATSFTIAHSITLIASAFGFVPGALWFPPLIETLIAISILYMAVENVVSGNVRRRWMLAFGFGLIHGFGFSFALRENLQFAGSHLLTSLLSFNVGVELGQIFVLILLVPALAALFRFVVPERLGTIILSLLVGHTAWHWMLERGGELARFPLPRLDAATAASALRWLMGLVALGGLVWLVSVIRSHRAQRKPARKSR